MILVNTKEVRDHIHMFRFLITKATFQEYFTAAVLKSDSKAAGWFGSLMYKIAQFIDSTEEKLPCTQTDQIPYGEVIKAHCELVKQ